MLPPERQLAAVLATVPEDERRRTEPLLPPMAARNVGRRVAGTVRRVVAGWEVELNGERR